MGKIMRSLRRFSRKNLTLLSFVVAALTVAAFAFPREAGEVFESAQDNDLLGGLLDGLGLNDSVAATGQVREFTLQYQSGILTNLGSAEADDATEQDFAALSTAGAGTGTARFDLVCGSRVCGTTTAPYQDPLTYFVVTVPIGEASKLVVTAGSAVLEADL